MQCRVARGAARVASVAAPGFAGCALAPPSATRPRDGVFGGEDRTPWGYIAWRLAGEAGLKIVEEAEAARTNPGSEKLVELFRLAGPSVILLDELVAYARQLLDNRFEAMLSFVQSLTEAAKMSPGVLVVGSLPESDVEAGGEKGAQALRRLQAVFGRVHSTWLPATGDETYEIIRRRLFHRSRQAPAAADDRGPSRRRRGQGEVVRGGRAQGCTRGLEPRALPGAE